MTLHKRGKHWYGESQADIRGELIRYGKMDDEVPTQFKEVRCKCGGTTFRLAIDDNEGAAVRTCTRCEKEHPIGDSAEYLDDAELGECACDCGEERFEITVGVSLYEDSNDVRWVYIGCRCPACGLTSNYGDWASEYEDYEKYLKNA